MHGLPNLKIGTLVIKKLVSWSNVAIKSKNITWLFITVKYWIYILKHILNSKILNNLSYLHVTMPNIGLLALKKVINKIETKVC